MYDKLTKGEFMSRFREDAKENGFSYEGTSALWNYLEQIEEETGQPVEYDPVDFCANYKEYKDLKGFQKDYGDSYKNIKDIEKVSIVIPVKGGGFITNRF